MGAVSADVHFGTQPEFGRLQPYCGADGPEFVGVPAGQRQLCGIPFRESIPSLLAEASAASVWALSTLYPESGPGVSAAEESSESSDMPLLRMTVFPRLNSSYFLSR